MAYLDSRFDAPLLAPMISFTNNEARPAVLVAVLAAEAVPLLALPPLALPVEDPDPLPKTLTCSWALPPVAEPVSVSAGANVNVVGAAEGLGGSAALGSILHPTVVAGQTIVVVGGVYADKAVLLGDTAAHTLLRLSNSGCMGIGEPIGTVTPS